MHMRTLQMRKKRQPPSKLADQRRHSSCGAHPEHGGAGGICFPILDAAAVST